MLGSGISGLRLGRGSRVELSAWDWPASRRVWLWRRSGSSRVEGVIGRCAQRLIGRVGLIEVVVEQMGLLVSQTGRSDGWWSGRDPEVIQNLRHGGGCCDQGQQNHLRLAARTFETGYTEASFQQARPRQLSCSDSGHVREVVVHSARLIGSARVSRCAEDASARVGVIVLKPVAIGLWWWQRKQGTKSGSVCEHTVIPGQILVRGRKENREAFEEL
jgi:hypothetical protein